MKNTGMIILNKDNKQEFKNTILMAGAIDGMEREGIKVETVHCKGDKFFLKLPDIPGYIELNELEMDDFFKKWYNSYPHKRNWDVLEEGLKVVDKHRDQIIGLNIFR